MELLEPIEIELPGGLSRAFKFMNCISGVGETGVTGVTNWVRTLPSRWPDHTMRLGLAGQEAMLLLHSPYPRGTQSRWKLVENHQNVGLLTRRRVAICAGTTMEQHQVRLHPREGSDADNATDSNHAIAIVVVVIAMVMAIAPTPRIRKLPMSL